MATNLPQLEQTTCQYLTVCGQIKEGRIACRKRVAKTRPMVARYQSGASKAYVRVMPSGSGKHLHVDCALRDFFGNRELPQVTHRKSQVLELLETCGGATISATVVGVFAIPLDELPERGIIRSLSAESGSTGLRVRLTGGTLSVSGAPIRNVRWLLGKKEDKVSVQIEAERSFKVCDTYLEEALKWIDHQFKVFCLGRTENAAK